MSAVATRDTHRGVRLFAESTDTAFAWPGEYVDHDQLAWCFITLSSELFARTSDWSTWMSDQEIIWGPSPMNATIASKLDRMREQGGRPLPVTPLPTREP